MNNKAAVNVYPCLEAALRYQELGWSVVALCPPDHLGMTDDWHRCDSPGKRPWHAWKKLQERRSIADEIRPWWRQHPSSNVGIVLGPVSGLVRVDVDGDEGRRFLTEMAGGDIPHTLRFSSGGGGDGFLFAIPPDVELRTTTHSGEQVHSEIRFQGKGAQTVLPPSLHVSGQRYEWLPGCGPGEVEPALMPDWLVEKMRVRPKAQSAALFQSNPEYDRQVALSALESLSPARCANHDDWVNVGMAMHSVDASLLPEWDAWSRGCNEKYRDGECAARWASFDGDGGLTIATLVKWAQENSPGWKPPRREAGSRPHRSPDDAAVQTRISNGRQVKRGEEEITVPLSMREILEQISRVTGNWPRRIGTALFIQCKTEIQWLEKTAALGAYIGSVAGTPPRFYRGVGFHSLAEVFEELRRVSTAYQGVEQLPHYPQVKGVYYASSIPEAGDGSKLRELVDWFSPETAVDSDLILAAFVTPGWGGTGRRPSYWITSDQGRGKGKTTLAKLIGRLWGGILDVTADEPAESVKQRLLSPEGITKRVALIDNIKSMRFSSASLEALVTADTISGKRMYVCEASRPNNLTWLTTLNGVSFATDWAQRSVVIKLAKPDYSGTWQDGVEEFIDTNRDAIIADCIGFLQRPAEYRLETFTRWGNWERDILSRLPDPAEAQRVILERQGEADAEGEETSTFEDHVRQRLQDARYQPETDRVFIPSKLAATWLSDVTGDRCGVTKASRFIRQRIREGGLKCLAENTCKTYGRGFVWNGPTCNMDDAVKTDIECRGEQNNGLF